MKTEITNRLYNMSGAVNRYSKYLSSFHICICLVETESMKNICTFFCLIYVNTIRTE